MKKNINDYKNIHLIGIGGASMYSIAAMLHHDKVKVTGSDLSYTSNIEHLEKLGIKITIGHNPEVLKQAELVIYTAAISEDDPELIFAKENNIEIVERAVFLGEYTKNYENLICISGKHVKITTTLMIANKFMK